MLNKDTFFLVLLLFIPVSIAAHFLEWGPTVVFITAALGIVPLANYMGKATEEIAVVTGPNIGGLLNATFGNATELILAFIALKAGLVEELKLIIELGADVNANSSEVPFSTRPLDYATSLGRLEMVRILLDSGAQVTGEQGWLPLAGAVENDSIEISNILVSAGASLTLPAPIGAEPLIQKAARANACRVLPLLLKAGHDINAYDEDNSVWPILATAILSNSQEFFLLALKLGADPNIAYQGKNVLAWAVHWKELRLTSPFWKGERDSADKFDFFIDELKNQ